MPRNRIDDLGLGDEGREESGDRPAPRRDRATVNLTVDADLQQEWREWCVRHRRQQREAFREAFDLLKERYGR